MAITDLTEELDDIRRRYPEWWHSDEARLELQALWGGADCNDCGVFERDETIRIQLDNFALFSCFVDGEPAAAIVAVNRDGEDYNISPLFVALTPGMVLTDHDGRPCGSLEKGRAP
jgi:hypothetical protein